MLRREHLLDGLNDHQEEMIYRLAYGRAQGTVSVQEWLAALKSLQGRRRAGSWKTWEPLGPGGNGIGW